jgi:ketosteroid isomerase-like protein
VIPPYVQTGNTNNGVRVEAVELIQGENIFSSVDYIKPQTPMTRIPLMTSSLLISITIFSSCNKTGASKAATEEGKPNFDIALAKKEIEDANRNFMDLVAKGDSVGLANFYTEDAKFMNAGAPAVEGRANIQTAMSEIIKSGVTKVDVRTKDVFGTEGLLAEEGELTIFIKNDVVAEEKYIVLWKKEEGRWKLFRDIFNSNLPAPPSK